MAKSKDFKSNGFGDQRESQNVTKKSLKESFPRSEEEKSMPSEIRQSRFQSGILQMLLALLIHQDNEDLSAIEKREQPSAYQYEVTFTKCS